MPIEIPIFFQPLNFIPYVPKNLANAIAVATLANSEGWIPNPPNPNQDLAPFTSLPKNKTATFSRMAMI